MSEEYMETYVLSCNNWEKAVKYTGSLIGTGKTHPGSVPGGLPMKLQYINVRTPWRYP